MILPISPDVRLTSNYVKLCPYHYLTWVTTIKSHTCDFIVFRPPLPESSVEKMKRFKRRLSQTLRGSHTIDESLSELAEQMTIEENGLKDSGTL